MASLLLAGANGKVGNPNHLPTRVPVSRVIRGRGSGDRADRLRANDCRARLQFPCTQPALLPATVELLCSFDRELPRASTKRDCELIEEPDLP
jgi:hypothetical protein